MLKIQTRWKVGAFLLAAPLLVTTAARADYERDYSAAQTVDVLKVLMKFKSADGDVLVFRQDGRFEYRRGKASAKGLEYLADYGRFTVKKKFYNDGSPNPPTNYLILKATSSKRKSDGKIVEHTDMGYHDIRVKSPYKEETTDATLYLVTMDKRFNPVLNPVP